MLTGLKSRNQMGAMFLAATVHAWEALKMSHASKVHAVRVWSIKGKQMALATLNAAFSQTLIEKSLLWLAEPAKQTPSPQPISAGPKTLATSPRAWSTCFVTKTAVFVGSCSLRIVVLAACLHRGCLCSVFSSFYSLFLGHFKTIRWVEINEELNIRWY